MWISADWRRSLSLGVLSSPKRKKGRTTRTAAAVTAAAAEQATNSFLNEAVAPYIYHLAGMTVIALLVMHVNVATRFLSSSPALYWGAAVILKQATQNRRQDSFLSVVVSNWIWLWALISAVLGCLLFPNFFPWT